MATYWANSCSFGLRYVSWNKYLIVSFFSHLGFWSGNLFLIAPFPDLCLLVPFYMFCISNIVAGSDLLYAVGKCNYILLLLLLLLPSSVFKADDFLSKNGRLPCVLQ